MSAGNKNCFGILCALLLSFGLNIVMFISFMVAYFNGYRVTLTVNDFGEAHIEFLMICIIMLLNVFGIKWCYDNFKEVVLV